MLTSSLSYDLAHRAGSRRPAIAVEVVRDDVPVRFGRVSAVHLESGSHVEARTDADGQALLDLTPGRWSVVARDARRRTCSASASIEVGESGVTGLRLPLASPTAELLVTVSGADALPVTASHLTVLDAVGHPVTASLVDGLAHVRGLAAGPSRIVVPPSYGHLGVTVDVDVDEGTLVSCTAVVPAGGLVAGRVLQGGAIQYAAVVALLDAEGTEIERTRTDADGCFLLGTGLCSSRGLTVVATSGPQTLHATSAAVADVVVLTGTYRDLGDLHLPATGAGAVWASRTRAVAGMKLPSTRV
jgi:hypothetical protein